MEISTNENCDENMETLLNEEFIIAMNKMNQNRKKLPEDEYIELINKLYEMNQKHFTNSSDSIKNYKNNLEELFRLRYSILQDELIEKEHVIASLTNKIGSLKEQISLYREIQVELRRLADEARKFGLKEDSSYILDLSNLWHEYEQYIFALQNPVISENVE